MAVRLSAVFFIFILVLFIFASVKFRYSSRFITAFFGENVYPVEQDFASMGMTQEQYCSFKASVVFLYFMFLQTRMSLNIYLVMTCKLFLIHISSLVIIMNNRIVL
jgi:hypothetical protein